MIDTLADQTTLRVADILCATHRATAADAVTWPFANASMHTPSAECINCSDVLQDIQVRLGEGHSAHVVVFSDLPETDRHAIHAVHEAGHVVADIVHGLTVESAVVGIDTTTDFSGYVAYNGVVHACRHSHVTDADYAVTLMAGTAAAEHYLTHRRGQRLTVDDRVELALQTRGDMKQLHALDRVDAHDAFGQARRFVAAHQDAIEAVSQHLQTQVYATGADLTALDAVAALQ